MIILFRPDTSLKRRAGTGTRFLKENLIGRRTEIGQSEVLLHESLLLATNRENMTHVLSHGRYGFGAIGLPTNKKKKKVRKLSCICEKVSTKFVILSHFRMLIVHHIWNTFNRINI